MFVAWTPSRLPTPTLNVASFVYVFCNYCSISFSEIIQDRNCQLWMEIVSFFFFSFFFFLDLNPISHTVLPAFKCACFARTQRPRNLRNHFRNKSRLKKMVVGAKSWTRELQGRMMGVSRQLRHLYSLIIHSNAVIRLHWNLQQAISTIWTHQMEITDWRTQSAF